MTVGEIITPHALHRPNKTAIIERDRRVTYGELEDKAGKFAGWLERQGIEPGERIALLERTSARWVVAALGALKAGAILVPINNLLRPQELSFILSDSEPSTLLCGEDYLGLAEEATRSGWDSLEIIALPEWDALDSFKPRDAASARAKSLTSSMTPCVFIYTAGTTGVPRAAIYSHHAFWHNLLSAVIDAFCQTYDEVWLGPVPLYHIGGLGALMRALLMSNTFLIKDRFDAEEYVYTIFKENVTILYAYPTMLNAMMGTLSRKSLNLKSLKLVIYGGSPISLELLKQMTRRLGCHFLQRYGSTETAGGAISVLAPQHHRMALEDPRRWGQKLESAGVPALGVTVRLVDESGRVIKEPGQGGEIVARLPCPMMGYWKRDEETREVLKDGWLYTGDIGMFDKEGFLYIVDRKKDVIISGARNIYAREVEKTIEQHPAVQEVAVIGVPDAYWGEAVKALIVLKPGMRATESEIIDFCKQRLASYKKPRSVEFVDSLPKNPGGKVLKRELRERYWVGMKRRVS